MNLLAIETATEACSVALACDGEILERFEIARRRHSDLLLGWIDALLAEAGIAKTQLDAIAVGKGPGAFTGVRLGVALASGIAFALDRPLLAPSTLAALAVGAVTGEQDCDRIIAAIDARMGEVYFGEFRRSEGLLVVAFGPELLVAPNAAIERSVGVAFGVGSGFAVADGALAARLGRVLTGFDATALPHAAAVARLALAAHRRGEAIAPEAIEPTYLRNKVAETEAERSRKRSG